MSDSKDDESDRPHLVVGLDVSGLLDPASIGTQPHARNVFQALQAARKDDFDFVTTIIPDTTSSKNKTVREDITSLDSKWWSTCVVGIIPDIETVASRIAWSQHMDLPAVILPPLPTTTDAALVSAYASFLAPCLSSVRGQQLWIPVELHAENVLSNWFLFQQLIDYHPSVAILLILEPAPISGTPADIVQAFVSETLYRFHILLGSAAPVLSIGLRTSLFIDNKKGYPVISKTLQSILSYMLRRTGNKVRLLLVPTASSNPTTLSAPDIGLTGTLAHLQYLRHFRSTRPELKLALDTEAAKQEVDYHDTLQIPLQPLADHLQFLTYEVFEMDPVKYLQYQKAITRAMLDRQSPQNRPRSNYIIVVAGAGRGPLVTACLEAHRSLQSPFQCHIFAVEKNPSAVLYLKSKVQKDWGNAVVTVIESDLRDLSLTRLFGPESTATVHLVVSELLGSFGCNELSPECLDALFTATGICGPETVSIPTRYTSFLAPVASTKLHQKVVEQALFPDPQRGALYTHGLTEAVETPYVVRTHAASQMCPAQPCWSFSHPPPNGAPPQHDCQAELTFSSHTNATNLGSGYGPVDDATTTGGEGETATQVLSSTSQSLPWTCSGLLGTFTAELYMDPNQSNHALSTNPETFSRGMFSWFPLYFPLTKPLIVPAGGTLHASIRRRHSSDRVWYEWSVHVKVGTDTLVAASPIHNPGGRSYHVSLRS